jgi:hypothetical protein
MIVTPTTCAAALRNAARAPRLSTFIYTEHTSHTFSVEMFRGPRAPDVAGFWIACLRRRGERRP